MAEIPWMPRWSVTLGALALLQGARIPRGYGMAWSLPYTDRAVFMPIPLNWIAAWLRRTWLRAKKAELRDDLASLYRYGHSKGFTAGESHGYDKGLRQAQILVDAIRPIKPPLGPPRG